MISDNYNTNLFETNKSPQCISLRAVCPENPPHLLTNSEYDWDGSSRQYGQQVGEIGHSVRHRIDYTGRPTER